MANDIDKAVSSNPIKNGSVVTNALFTGYYKTYNYYVKNTPTIDSIQDKYTERFDDITYYTIGSGNLIGD